MRNSHPILCINTGSSSLKCALYETGGDEERLLVRGAVERIGLHGGPVWLENGEHTRLLDDDRDVPDHRTAVKVLCGLFHELQIPRPDAIGHRVVHGGSQYTAHAPVTAELLAAVGDLIPFAPLHLPGAIEVIEAVSEQFPGLPQVACFDTVFHRRMPEIAQRFALPRRLWDEEVRRYGFHGLSYEYILSELGPDGGGRLIVAHLGNGASLAAVLDGCPRDTTMGFTPTGGLMMGTRSGDLDPGIIIYLISEKGYHASQIDELVNHQSGLVGVSGSSPDMKTLLEKRSVDRQAALAVDMFCYQLRKHIGALAAALGGLDTLVFTGGIGERAAPVRWETCQGLQFLGIVLDDSLNTKHADVISRPDSSCAVRVIPTNEDLMIARHTGRIVFGDS